MVGVGILQALHILSVFCSLSYPAGKAHAPYCHLWPVRLQNIFPHYLINGTIFFWKEVTEHKMCVLIFSTTLAGKFLILRRNERDVIKNV